MHIIFFKNSCLPFKVIKLSWCVTGRILAVNGSLFGLRSDHCIHPKPFFIPGLYFFRGQGDNKWHNEGPFGQRIWQPWSAVSFHLILKGEVIGNEACPAFLPWNSVARCFGSCQQPLLKNFTGICNSTYTHCMEVFNNKLTRLKDLRKSH